MKNPDPREQSFLHLRIGWEMILRHSLHIGIAFLLFLFVFLCPRGNAQEKKDIVPQGVPTNQMEKSAGELPSGVGVIEVPRADGGKDKIYFSTFSPEEEEQARAEEKEKQNRSWDMLKNILIDKRSR